MPADHMPSCRQVDEDVWTELRNFKKCLIQMFMAEASDGVLLHSMHEDCLSIEDT